MIELRWLIRDTGRPSLDGPGTIKERVLQYRIKGPVVINPYLPPVQPRYAGEEWGEWQDVPTISE